MTWLEPDWKSMKAKHLASALRQWQAEVQQHGEKLYRLEAQASQSRELGKPLTNHLADKLSRTRGAYVIAVRQVSRIKESLP